MPDTVRISLEALAKKYENQIHAADPVAWVGSVLKAFTWSKQDEILRSLTEHRYTAVQSCHGVGKSFIAAAAVAWWISTKPIGKTYVITTAPTQAQVEAVLWKEIKRAHAITGLPTGSYITSGNPVTWKTADKRQIGMGRKPAEHDVGAFQGIHDEFLLIVIDEACGIPKVLYDAMDSMATGKHNRVLAIGNPDDPSSHFHIICKDYADWHTIRIDGLQSPNINDAACEEYPEIGLLLQQLGLRPNNEYCPDNVRENIMSARWVAERIRMWGVNSSLFQAKVRGEFPDNASEGVIPLAWVERAQARWRDWDEGTRNATGSGYRVEPRAPLVGRKIIGIDVARMGEDATCLATRQGPCITGMKQIHGKTGDEVARIACLVEGPDTLKHPLIHFIVDVIGVGASVYDNLNRTFTELDWTVPPTASEFNGSKTAPSMDSLGMFAFLNYRAWAWWRMRELLDPTRPGGSNIMLPPDDYEDEHGVKIGQQMKYDLCTPRWEISKSGTPPKIKIEDKDDIRKRLGRSPDLGDAVVMAFTADATPLPGQAPGQNRQSWGERKSFDERHRVHQWGEGSDAGMSIFGGGLDTSFRGL